MSLVRFSYFAPGYFGATVGALVLVALLAVRGDKRPKDLLFLAYLASLVCIVGGFFVRHSIYHPDFARPASYVIALYTCFSNALLLGFVYRFPAPDSRSKRRTGPAALFVAGLGAYAYYVGATIDLPVSYNHATMLFEFQSPASTRPMAMLHSASFVLILLVVYLRLAAMERSENGDFVGLFKLRSRNARALRALGGAIVVHLALSGLYPLYGFGWLSFLDFQSALTTLVSFQLFLYAAVYLTYAERGGTFLVKLIGVSAITLLATLSLVFRFRAEDLQRGFYWESVARARSIGSDSPATFLAEGYLYYAQRSYPGGARAEQRQTIWFRDPSFRTQLAAIEPRDPRSFRERMSPNGREERNGALPRGQVGPERSCGGGAEFAVEYGELAAVQGVIPLVRLCSEGEQSLIDIGISYARYRDYVHRAAGQMILATAGACAIVFLFFPLIFISTLIRPLRSLLSAIRVVESGNLNSSVTIETEDEVGALGRGFNGMVEAIRESRGRVEALAHGYSRFVPFEFLSLLGKSDITQVQIGDAVERDMTVFFSDIRSFTTISEGLSPAQTLQFLNGFLSAASPVIRRHNGFIDKFIGDAIMAIFPQSPEDALRAALEILERLAHYNRSRIKAGLSEVRVGIGLNSGPVTLGALGSEERMEATVVADAVNLASRVEGLTAVYGAGLLVTEQTLFRLNDPSAFSFRILDRVKVKGRSDPVSVFEIYDGDHPAQVELKRMTRPAFERGLHDFYNEAFLAAAGNFSAVLARNPHDRAALLYLTRSLYNQEHGVSPEWDGIAAAESR